MRELSEIMTTMKYLENVLRPIAYFILNKMIHLLYSLVAQEHYVETQNWNPLA